jgi:hypothetical protein
MSSNRLAFAALGMACIASAAGGGYLATRQNTVPTPAAAMSPAVTATPAGVPAAPAPAAAAERSVQETEAVVADAAKKSTGAPKPTAAKRVESQSGEPRAANSSGSASARRNQPPPLASTWPSSAASQPPAAPPLPAPTDTVPSGSAAPRVDDPARAAQDPPRAPEPQKTFEDLVIARDSVIGLQTETRISSETARVEDRVDARVTRDVRVGDRVAVPAGARAIGSVSLVERGGKFKERARLGIRFHTLVLADGTRVPINTETIFRDGDAPTNSSAQKVGGGTIGGAIIGAIIGGGKGAAIGAAAGAGAGSAAVMAGSRNEAVLPPGTPVTARISQPVTVTIERE